MEGTLEELAEPAEARFGPVPRFEKVAGDDFAYIAGPRSANLHPYRIGDVASAVEWSRAESRRRGHKEVEGWVGWRTEPRDLGEQLLALGLARGEAPPTLTGMTTTREPPAAPAIEVRRVGTEQGDAGAVGGGWEG